MGLAGGGAKGGGGAGKVWPVSTSKLLSPKVRGEEEEPGTLVIDEEHGEMAPVEVDYDFGSEDTPPAPGMVKTIGPNGKVEWKRYKQYTKDDILAAIEEVKNGEFNNTPFSNYTIGVDTVPVARHVRPASQQKVRGALQDAVRQGEEDGDPDGQHAEAAAAEGEGRGPRDPAEGCRPRHPAAHQPAGHAAAPGRAARAAAPPASPRHPDR